MSIISDLDDSRLATIGSLEAERTHLLAVEAAARELVHPAITFKGERMVDPYYFAQLELRLDVLTEFRTQEGSQA